MLPKVTPLPGSFMITAIVGFFISVVYVFPRSANWGFTFTLFFILMFIASMISVSYAPVDEHLKFK